ncbi:ORF133 [Lymantria xylina nucleopolyhedrovirus]|uniref:ORF133 n=1 Tax=Lymantria xylina multiple nucleopolyhedrovirus TaxID=2847840 RepID=D4N2H0_9ABAC|nr:ORF133 [Lymantria xylina nucleopolyhedrovirus]ADD73842.1 ORF133 [Lymantria xylina nucleopolyhedrovirus]
MIRFFVPALSAIVIASAADEKNDTTPTLHRSLSADAEAPRDIDALFALIMVELQKIQNSEISDFSYTKLILILLILIMLYSLKTKLYKLSMCCNKKKRRDDKRQQAPLENITIQEFNYNVTETSRPLTAGEAL